MARWKTVLGCPIGDQSLYTSSAAANPGKVVDNAEHFKNEVIAKESLSMASLSNQVAGLQAKSKENRNSATKTVFGCPIECQHVYKSRTGRKIKCDQGDAPPKTVFGCPVSNEALYTR